TSLPSSTRPACADADSGTPASAKPTVSAPPLITARRERREVLTEMVMSASLSRRRHDRANDALVRAATAEIAVEGGADIGLAGLLVFGQQRSRAHEDAAGAVAAPPPPSPHQRRLQPAP